MLFLFRDAAAIKRLPKIDTLIVDKTGTLTEGKPVFDHAAPAPGFIERDVVRIAASIDQGNEHPLAQAIVAEARRRGIALDRSAFALQGEIACFGYRLLKIGCFAHRFNLNRSSVIESHTHQNLYFSSLRHLLGG